MSLVLLNVIKSLALRYECQIGEYYSLNMRFQLILKYNHLYRDINFIKR